MLGISSRCLSLEFLQSWVLYFRDVEIHGVHGLGLGFRVYRYHFGGPHSVARITVLLGLCSGPHILENYHMRSTKRV